ncbi:transposase domain-containing protein [Apostichopus japonicus]|uniref:Transposase domain-containing protein n=1 Tax=Stichopus japonicus TaxID=307972 RepID=A0A2G8K6Z2_STIJA|nr:transposase domain-containing protein [Apostichopus japonicus]
MVRSGKNPLVQVAHRLAEYEKHQSKNTNVVPMELEISSAKPDNCYLLKSGHYCLVHAVNMAYILCEEFHKPANFYTNPCESQLLRISQVCMKNSKMIQLQKAAFKEKALTLIMEKYAIVEFQNSLAGVVPTSWIFKKDGKIWCKWTASRTKTIACELPNPSWTTSSIKRVVAYRASYSEADNVCLGFEHSSTVEVTEADLNFPEADPATSSSTSNSKRNIFRPLHYTGEPNSNTANLMKRKKLKEPKTEKRQETFSSYFGRSGVGRSQYCRRTQF